MTGQGENIKKYYRHGISYISCPAVLCLLLLQLVASFLVA